MENWIKLQNFEYEISDLGNLRNSRNQIIKPQLNKNGYHLVNIWKEGKRKAIYLHRLVLEAFTHCPDPLFTVNHKDGNKSNNRLDNLEWGSYSENLQHSYNQLKRPVNKSTGWKMVECHLNGNLIHTVKGIQAASRVSGVSPTQIRRLIQQANPQY